MEVSLETFERLKPQGISSSKGIVGRKYLMVHFNAKGSKHLAYLIQITGGNSNGGYWNVEDLCGGIDKISGVCKLRYKDRSYLVPMV